MQDPPPSEFQFLPSVDKLLQAPQLSVVVGSFGRESVRAEIRTILDKLRKKILSGDETAGRQIREPGFFDNLCSQIQHCVADRFNSSLVSVFNLTGTVVHTNLGRASLPETAITAMVRAAQGPVNLEFDLETGKRGDRDTHLEQVICEITGAEAATVVNNNAAAVVLSLTSLAVNRNVLISRGELVEIGGSFRIPEVMGSAGSILKEVGTTNRTHLKDYENAIDSDTALIMKVHTSNYEIRGFTKSVEVDELAGLAGKHQLPLVVDLGSGTLIDLQQFGLPHEPTVQAALESGADLVTFSGDKLFGGPQAGIIVGKRELIDRLKRNPLKRALRVDKVTMAALLEVLFLYRSPKELPSRLPILRDLTRSVENIGETAEQLLPVLEQQLAGCATVSIEPCQSQIGSGALPLELLESTAVVIDPVASKGATDVVLHRIALAFRKLPKPVVGRIRDGRLIFDLRCLHDLPEFTRQLSELEL
ncbi:MAG: L-seryl-tRNA(Sec) selenium transferase [Gammaproteobacteria bacterium]|nr:L-seryl-tRNA(Sec) selenium transferase [Gammaproteobacteria bacterium]